MLDATRMAPRLWQGSFPPVGPWVRADGFDVLVLAARELQPPAEAYPGVQVVRAPMRDVSPARSADLARAQAAAEHVSAALASGKRVLVTCAAGLNRSGTIVGLAMRRMRPDVPGHKIVEHVQAQRDFALSNPSFATYVATSPLT